MEEVNPICQMLWFKIDESIVSLMVLPPSCWYSELSNAMNSVYLVFIED